MERKIITVTFIVFTLIVIVFHKQLITHARILLIITQEFPGILIKPLNLVPSPTHKKISWKSGRGEFVSDVFIPRVAFDTKPHSLPVLIVAVGIKLLPQDHKNFIQSVKNLSKLGYLVVYPRSKLVDENWSKIESPDTFIEAFHYVENLKEVDKSRISIFGFSSGASVALIAAEDKYLNNRLHAFLFWGGYFNIFDYMESLMTENVSLNGKKISWKPKEDVVGIFKLMLQSRKTLAALNNLKKNQNFKWRNSIPNDEVIQLKKFNPSEYISQFKAPIFIIHDIDDKLIPYVESVKLNQALANKVKTSIILSDLFNHVRPRDNFSLNLDNFLKNYSFFYQVFSYL